MIRVNEKYYINTDETQYKLHWVTKKSDKVIGFYPNLETAINGLTNHMITIKLDEGEYNMKEAIEAIKEIKEYIRYIFEDV